MPNTLPQYTLLDCVTSLFSISVSYMMAFEKAWMKRSSASRNMSVIVIVSVGVMIRSTSRRWSSGTVKLVCGIESCEKNSDLKSDQNTLWNISIAFASCFRFVSSVFISSLFSSDFFSTPFTRTTNFRSYL